MMNRAVTEPTRLLEAYSEHLTDSGGIMQQSVSALVELMSSANRKLVPKCISLCIIASSSPETQLQLCKDGAWEILLKWLQEALKEDNYAFLLELLKVYLLLPVRLEQLTQNVCPKLINSLTKRCDHEEVKSVAAEIVKKWKEVISSDSRQLVSNHVKRKKVESETKTINKDAQSHDPLKDEKKRRSTVKIPPNNMRTAGMEDTPAQPQPKSRSDIFAKKNKVEHDKSLTSELPIESFHQKITVTPTESRKEIHESSDFINALTTSPCPVVRKKRKISPKIEPVVQTDLHTSKEENYTELSDQSSAYDSFSNSPKGMGSRKSSLSNIYSTFPADNKPKKRVSWADEDKLQSFYYFELDESERVNVNRVSIEDIRRKEHSMERQLFKRSHEDTDVYSQKWHPPCPLERLLLVEPGCKSIERQIQLERERCVLQAIYFTRESIPYSPEEPDAEVVEHIAPLDIPLDDLTAYESIDKSSEVNSERLLVMKDAMGNPQMSLNPEVANLVKSLAANLTSSPSDLVQTMPPQMNPVLTTTSCSDFNLQPNAFVPVSNDTKMNVNSPNSESVRGTNAHSPIDQMLQRELWEVLEQNYPDINVHDLSAERIRDLLEPLRDQLVARGIFQLRNPCPPKPPLQYPDCPVDPPVPRHGFRPPFRGPSHMPVPVPRSDFIPPHGPRLCPPNPSGYGPPNRMPNRPSFQSMNPTLPHLIPNPMPPYNGPPASRMPAYPRGNSHARNNGQPCKFFQQGGCRNGHSCNFMHSR
ncbi:unnamed protein product [Schistosoma haematobium]|nr:unnamed protein product [Schistosoma haematobium]CAH8444014.1 unnamed protein product [Schistosoma haematobium]